MAGAEKGSLLDSYAVADVVTDPRWVVLQPKPKARNLSPEFAEIFNREKYLIKGRVRLVIDGQVYPIHFERFGSDAPGDESSRVFFTPDEGYKGRRSVVTISPNDFTIGLFADGHKADFAKEPFPVCDDGHNRVVRPTGSIFLANRDDLRRGVQGGTIRTRVRELRISVTNPNLFDAPIFRRQITRPFMYDHRGLKQVVSGAMDGSSSIRDTDSLTEGTVAAVMAQLDPRIDYDSDYEWYTSGPELKITYPPAVEIAQMMVFSWKLNGQESRD